MTRQEDKVSMLYESAVIDELKETLTGNTDEVSLQFPHHFPEAHRKTPTL